MTYEFILFLFAFLVYFFFTSILDALKAPFSCILQEFLLRFLTFRNFLGVKVVKKNLRSVSKQN